MTFFSHRPQIMLFMCPKFTNDLFRRLTSNFTLFVPLNRQWVLFLRDSSLHKQSYITAHFRSSLHIFVHHCTFSFITAHFRSSLHIFVHHCTFCASLHVKTSPAKR